MHILLINVNPVVSRLISLCIRKENMHFEEVTNVLNITRDSYDVVFVDELSYVNELKDILENLIIREKVFLSSSNKINKESKLFDSIIKKPFLPSQIMAVFESLKEKDNVESEVETSFNLPPLSDKEIIEEIEKSVDKDNATVLDLNEIDKIKALLNMDEENNEINEDEYESRKVEVIKKQLIADGLEIVNEDEYIESLSPQPLEKKKKRKKEKKKKSKKSEEKFSTFEEALLVAVEGMKIKKIKKLLKNAEVTIKINFKDKK